MSDLMGRGWPHPPPEGGRPSWGCALLLAISAAVWIVVIILFVEKGFIQ